MTAGEMRLGSDIPIFVINLDRAPERFETVCGSARDYGLSLTRVSAIDGQLLPPQHTLAVDLKAFRRQHGRVVLPGEIGCYHSHLKALGAFLDSPAKFGLILEDDVKFREDSISRISAIVSRCGQFGVVKLVNHRSNGFITQTQTQAGDQIGRTMFGPQGSAAAYLVSREGALELLEKMALMSLPFDVALERGWTRLSPFYSVKTRVFSFSKHRSSSAISGKKEYAKSKPRWYYRIPTAFFRTLEQFQRLIYALRQ
ncbi:MAG: glycosyltransferase family 25 protein [Pseudomonadota bacterium]